MKATLQTQTAKIHLKIQQTILHKTVLVILIRNKKILYNKDYLYKQDSLYYRVLVFIKKYK